MKRAYHRLQFPDGRLVEGPVVVETDGDESFVSWHLLQREEPSTVWCGGTYQLGTNNS